ncbi:glycoside hydrolase family 43 protein [Sphingomonas sp. LHG3406-1]|uniref:glycoside hydrolase family 43 protein n=1 Tax=Sphingomonas sp. LHG3406-1 TaxID=2804617 RepID=UPI002622A632|nr:glycoside hydrolase family 43 protein [Sphingomonas sp. LHG3406-1]
MRRPSLVLAIASASLVSAPTAASANPAEFDWFEYRGDDALPRPVPGQYANPILAGFYPDPSITRAGDDYYLVTSTFAYFPGLPIFHSRDLVNWRQIGNAIDRPDMVDFGKLGLSRGLFAPAIEYHQGTFYILNTCVDCGDNFVITAKDPRGPWSKPSWLPDLKGGIDPSLFFDEDGSAWVINNGPPIGTPRYDGHRALWLQRFDPKTLKTFGERTMLLDGGVKPETNPIWIEGPHIFRKDGWYYLLAAEGGTAEGHSQVMLRSKSVTGPYTPNPNNPILTQRDLPRDRARPITSAGHADFVTTRNGEWWATFLAVRPYTGDYYNTGRETFLMPVRWENGWPRITAPGEVIPWVHARPGLPASAAAPTTGPLRVREEFDRAALPLDWLMMRNPQGRWWRAEEGRLKLEPRATGLGDNGNPSFLARRQQHQNASATTAIRPDSVTRGTEAGLVALQSDEYWFAILLGRDAAGRATVTLRGREGPEQPAGGVELARQPLANGARPAELRITARADRYDFAWRQGGGWRTLRRDVDGTVLSTKRAGGFVGAVFGLYAHQPKGRP